MMMKMWSKFRAIPCGFKNKFVYGVGVLETTLAYDFLVLEKLKIIDIVRNSFAQHVAYDKDRNEVYEDDTLVDDNGNELSVVLALKVNGTGELLPIDDHYRILDYRLKRGDTNARD